MHPPKTRQRTRAQAHAVGSAEARSLRGAAPDGAGPPVVELRRLRSGLHIAVATRAAARGVGADAPVAVALWFRAGTADERPGEHGIAHLLEHVVFKPFEIGGQSVDLTLEIEREGGDINAFTSHDETVFELVVARRRLRKSLTLLAAAIGAPRFDPMQVEREREVVAEEIRQYDDDPDAWIAERSMALSFPGHGYGRSILGTLRDVGRHDARGLARFHRRQYALSRAVLVLVGPVRVADAVSLARQAFEAGGRASRRVPSANARARRVDGDLPRRPVAAVALPRAHHEVVRRDVAEAHIRLQWVGPSAGHPDAAALEVAAAVLGEGEASRLARRLRRGHAVVTEAWAGFVGQRAAGSFTIAATTPPSRAAVADAALRAEVERLRTLPVERDELARARALLLGSSLFRRQTVQGQAGEIGHALCVLGGLRAEARDRARIAEMTPQQVTAACARWLDRARCVSVVAVPQGASGRAAAVALRGRRTSTAPKGAVRARVPVHSHGDGVHELRLASGLRVFAIPDDSLEICAGALVRPGGARADRTATCGAMSLLSGLLTRGTLDRDGDALADELERLSASIDGFCGRSTAGLTFEALASDTATVMARLFECFLRPRLPPLEVERERDLVREALIAERDDLAHRAYALARARAYGRHPSGRPTRGTPESLARVTQRVVMELASRQLQLGGACLALAGAIDVKGLDELVEALTAGARGPRRPPQPQARAATPRLPRRPVQVHEARRRGQVYAHWIAPGLALADARRPALEVANVILGGTSGRLFSRLREREGLVYEVGTSTFEGIDGGHVSIWASAGTAKFARARAAVEHELRTIAAAGVSADEVVAAQHWLLGAHERGQQHRLRVALGVATSAALGLRPTATRDLAAKIAAVRPAQVDAIVRETFGQWRVLATVGARRG